MVNKNIFVLLLCTFCFLRSAEHTEFDFVQAVKVVEELFKEFIITSEDEQALAHERSEIFALNNQKNRHSQNTGNQKYAQINMKRQKKYNNGKHRNNSGR